MIRRIEAILDRKVQDLTIRAQMMLFHHLPSDNMDGLIKLISSELSPVHHVVFKVLALKDNIAALRCSFVESSHERLIAAKSGLELVRPRIEYGAAQCNGFGCLPCRHPVVYSSTPYIYQATQDVLRYDPSGKSWPAAMCTAIKRYLVSMDLYYGADDCDVQEIRAKLNNAQRTKVESTAQKKKTAAGNKKRCNNKKKKRGKTNHW